MEMKEVGAGVGVGGGVVYAYVSLCLIILKVDRMEVKHI